MKVIWKSHKLLDRVGFVSKEHASYHIHFVVTFAAESNPELGLVHIVAAALVVVVGGGGIRKVLNATASLTDFR